MKFINFCELAQQTVYNVTEIEKIEYFYESDFLRVTMHTGKSFALRKFAKQQYVSLYKYLQNTTESMFKFNCSEN